MIVHGIHHITAITSDAQRNLTFYSEVLGLRLVKVTVNFDDPASYHLYYGDSTGAPGSILTFFAWPGSPRGIQGSGQVLRTYFSVPPGALEFWKQRLKERGVSFEFRLPNELELSDPDGLALALVEHGVSGAPSAPWISDGISSSHAIRGFAGAELSSPRRTQTKKLLFEELGLTPDAQLEDAAWFSNDPHAAWLRLNTEVSSRGTMGAGVVHHIAFRISDDMSQAELLERLMSRGYMTSSVMERCYFKSIYFREPSGVLFEVATDSPGFTVDETEGSLGSSLCLPPWLEPQREEIARKLPPLKLERAGS